MAPILLAPASRRTTVNSVFSSAGGGGRGGGGGGGGDRGGGGHAPLGLEVFDQTGDFEDGLAREPFDDLIFGDVAHDDLLLPTSGLGRRRV
jgi:hypothetical protein